MGAGMRVSVRQRGFVPFLPAFPAGLACSPTILTIADPTITPSAPAFPYSRTCSGEDIPNPGTTGSFVLFLMALRQASVSGAMLPSLVMPHDVSSAGWQTAFQRHLGKKQGHPWESTIPAFLTIREVSPFSTHPSLCENRGLHSGFPEPTFFRWAI